MKILVCGDIVGRSGREVIEKFLPELVSQNEINFVIVNGENSASGFGITRKICEVFKVDDVEISENLDKSILGGYIIKVGDTIIDCSTKNKLNDLENHLLRSTTL